MTSVSVFSGPLPFISPVTSGRISTIGDDMPPLPVPARLRPQSQQQFINVILHRSAHSYNWQEIRINQSLYGRVIQTKAYIPLTGVSCHSLQKADLTTLSGFDFRSTVCEVKQYKFLWNSSRRKLVLPRGVCVSDPAVWQRKFWTVCLLPSIWSCRESELCNRFPLMPLVNLGLQQQRRSISFTAYRPGIIFYTVI